jgi:hypothetical protein
MTLPALLDRIVCVSSLSKDLEGELRRQESEQEECSGLRCKTLQTVHVLDLRMSSHADCDSPVARRLDGAIRSDDLVHKFKDGDGRQRGIHQGSFRWTGRGTLITGTLQGITNAGTHRQPAFSDCQRCESPGVMEGLMLGTILRVVNKRLIGCRIEAAYRLHFDASSEGGEGAVTGSLEGAIVCDCRDRPTRTCVELSALPPGPGPNPRREQDVDFGVLDGGGGSPPPTTEIRSQGAWVGLNVGFRTEVKLPVPCSAVEATIVTWTDSPIDLQAFSAGAPGAAATSTAGVQDVAATLSVAGSSIDSVVITAKQNETILLRLCYEPALR